MRPLLLALFLVAPLSAATQPNLVVFLADDAGWGDYSHSGNTQLATPHIDSIAQKGISLDRFYVQPVCSPTRAEFLTGRYHPRTGVKGVSTGQERLNLDEKTLADALKAAGYATGAYGKWHNGTQWPYHPMARGFDDYFGHTSGHWGEYFDPPLEDRTGRLVRTQGYIADICTDRALDFITRHKDRPFFCYIPFTTPHSPWAAPADDWARFKDKPITQTATPPSQENPDETRCAYAMLENQDRNVGRVLNLLRQHGLHENTIVLYFSDNGPNSARWTGGMKGRKGQTDEGGIRSVCYLSYPAQLPQGRTIPQIAAAIDLYPTLLALTGTARVGEKPLDGRDLTPLLQAQDPASTPWPERTLFSTWAGQISARTQTHRLDHLGNLYNMVTDPGQSMPVNDQEPELAQRLQDAVSDWRLEMFGTRETPIARNLSKTKPNAAAKAKTPQAKAKAGGSAVDPRPIPVGYREFPVTLLPARDGEPQGTVKRSSSAPNCSYFVNWTSTEDRLVWNLRVHTAGTYQVELDYTCPEADAGSTIELRFKDASLTGQVTPYWDPPLLTNQDTLPRPHGESTMKDFKTLDLGRITLPSGEGALTLRALTMTGRTVMDLRRITLTLFP